MPSGDLLGLTCGDDVHRHEAGLLTCDDARRGTLIAERTETPTGIVYRFDIHMQGPRETVFFDA